MDQAKKYRLLALAQHGWYSPGIENVDREMPDTINGHMMDNEENRQLARSSPGLSYKNYQVGRSRKASKIGKGLGIANQAFDYYKSSGDING